MALKDHKDAIGDNRVLPSKLYRLLSTKKQVSRRRSVVAGDYQDRIYDGKIVKTEEGDHHQKSYGVLG